MTNEHHHFVQFFLQAGDYPRIEYTCTAPEDADCRTWCQTCMDEQREQCECGFYDGEDAQREPVLTHGHPCNIVAWLENEAPQECYDGADQPVRGPEPQPITVSWEGDYYVWDYHSNSA